jgi:hypothetical protein
MSKERDSKKRIAFPMQLFSEGATSDQRLKFSVRDKLDEVAHAL